LQRQFAVGVRPDGLDQPRNGRLVHGQNWSPSPPTAGLDALVAFGGTATASSQPPVLTGDLTIGLQTTDPVVLPEGNGTVKLADTSLQVIGDLLVGHIQGSGRVKGILTMSNTDTIAEFSEAFGNVTVALAEPRSGSGTAAGRVSGTVVLSDQLLSNGTATQLVVGTTSRAGSTATGEISLGGLLSGFDLVAVGWNQNGDGYTARERRDYW